MKKLMSIALLVLVIGSLTGCGARGRAVKATATAQALTATAMAQPPMTPVPAVSAPGATGVILFQDDFQDGQPDGWQITAGWCVQQEGNVYYLASSGQGMAWVSGGGNWSDYEFQAAIRVTAGGVLLSYRMTQEGRYLLHFREDGLYLSKEYPKGNYTALTQTTAPSFNAWHQIAVAGYGGHLQVYVDRMLQLDYTDPSPLLRGTVAVATLEGYQAAVDDVLVTRLTAPLPTPVPMAVPVTVPPPATPLLPAGAELPSEEVAPSEGAPPPSAAGLPVIDYFYSEPSDREGCYYLHWDLHDASVAYLNGVGVVAPGSQEVCPEETTTYTLRAENEAGSTEESVTIEVGGAPSGGEGTPAAPSNLRMPEWSMDTVTLEWDDNSDNEDGFRVRQVGVAWVAETGPNETRATIPAPPCGETAQYRVRAFNSAGTSDPSNTLEVTGSCAPGPPAGQPDLVVLDAHFEPDPVTRGQPFDAVFTIANQGNADAGAFTVLWHFHAATGLADCSWDRDSLGAGEQASGRCTRSTTAQPGTSPTRLTVDVEGEIAESNEGNNEATPTLTVAEAESAGRPDLVIDNLSIEPNPVLLGGIGVFTVRFNVINVGNAQAAPSTAHWEIVADDRWSFDCPVTTLPPMMGVPCEHAFMGLPSEPSNYGTRAIADFEGTVAESDEGNNVTKETLQVQQ